MRISVLVPGRGNRARPNIKADDLMSLVQILKRAGSPDSPGGTRDQNFHTSGYDLLFTNMYE